MITLTVQYAKSPPGMRINASDPGYPNLRSAMPLCRETVGGYRFTVLPVGGRST